MPHRQLSTFQRSTAKRLRSSMSEAEKRLWYFLRAHRFCGASLRRQTPIGRYVVDFICHDAGLIVELDGGQHGMTKVASHDGRRTTWLVSQGYKVVRFWNNDVLCNTDAVLEVIAAELQDVPPSRFAASRRPDLPLKGGGDEQVAT